MPDLPAPLPSESLIGKIDVGDEAAWPNERIGKYLLAARLADQAFLLCPDDPKSVSPAQYEAWRLALAREESDDAALVPLEKAQRLSSRGEFERAGHLFRQLLIDGAIRFHDERDAAAARERLAKNRAGGAKGGSRPKPGKLPNDICEQYRSIVASGRSEREARSVLRQKYRVSGPGLAKALKKAL